MVIILGELASFLPAISVMTLSEKIAQQVHLVPESAQLEVLDFVEFLQGRSRRHDEDNEWSRFSLSQAMRGMEREPDLYSVDDLREVF